MPINSSITIGREDVLRGKIVDAGWHTCIVKDVSEDLTKAGDSTVYIVDLTVSGGKFDGTPLKKYFSEKAVGFMVNYFKAFGVQGLDGKADRVTITPEMFNATIGRTVDVMVVTGSYNNAPTNNVMDFRAKASASSAPSSVGKLG